VPEPSPPGRRPSILAINQYYDSIEASGQLLRHLCEDLSESFDVTVVAARPPAVPGAFEGRRRPGLRVVWAQSTHLPRSSLALRALNYASFLASVIAKLVRTGRPDVVVCMTDPPVIGLIGLCVARLRGARLLMVFQDVHPDVGIVSSQLTNPAITGILRLNQRTLLSNADHAVAIGEAMRQRFIERGAHPDRISVIPNWTDLADIKPEPRDNRWARERDLTDRFVVMHAGNLGLMQSLGTLLDAAARLPDVIFAFVGEGSSKAALAARAEREGLRNVRFFPHEAPSRVRHALASADAQIVSLLPGLAGLIEPSKIYSVLAAERPIVAAMEAETEAARMIAAAQCGVTVRPGDANALVEGIERLKGLPREEREAMGRRGREAARELYSRERMTAAYSQLVSALAAGSDEATNGLPISLAAPAGLT
jgi:putative colanic acid biosynthesis glycosyltransferase WcaI